MIADQIYAPFMELLRAGLWNNPPDLNYFPLDKESWVEIKSAGLRQTVGGIIYDGILLLPDEIQPPSEILIAWSVEVELLEQRNRKINQSIKELYTLFAEHGIYPVLLKGQGIAAFYNVPRHRVCGDIDWYIANAEDRMKAERILAEKGVKMQEQAGFSMMYVYNGIVVEHHSRLIDSHNPFCIRMLKKLEGRELDNALTLSMLGEKISLPSPLMTHLQVNMHILKHMLSFGIGLRQLCDSARICRSLHAQTDGEALKKIYKETGILRWVSVLHELLNKDLGLPEVYLPFANEGNVPHRWMMQEVWHSGNFGFYDNRFGGQNKTSQSRSHMFRHWVHRFLLHVKYAPTEAIWFPFAQIYSRNTSIFNKNIHMSSVE